MRISRKNLDRIRTLVGKGWRNAANDIRQQKDDFEYGGYRFIHVNAIDKILEEDLQSDFYILGCFKASFIAEVTGWPLFLIEAAQKGEQYEDIGRAIVEHGHLTDLATQYAKADGYGHHFATYDGHEHDIHPDYYAFRIE